MLSWSPSNALNDSVQVFASSCFYIRLVTIAMYYLKFFTSPTFFPSASLQVTFDMSLSSLLKPLLLSMRNDFSDTNWQSAAYVVSFFYIGSILYC